MLTESEELELIGLLEAEQAILAHDSLAVYASATLDVIPAKHHLLLIDALESVERGELDVLIVCMPPGSAKSTYGSVAFPAWYLGRNPKKCVIAGSHTAELAERFGRKVRNIVGSTEANKIFPDVMIAVDSAAAGRWETSKGGEYFAAGVGGSITGRRADLAIIDDPVKSREDADSETVREKQWAWWRDDLTTRLKPGAAVVLIMTRWHEDDLGGRLIADLKTSNQRYKILSLSMEALENDPLGREVGEPLWPEWFTDQMIEVAKREPRTWSALYQQQPRPIGGGEFKLAWLNYYRNKPVTNKVILVDPSSGKKTGTAKQRAKRDYTSMWVVGTGADGNDYVIDGIRDRLNLSERTDALFGLVREHQPMAVGYEQYGLQADIEHIKLEQETQQYRFRIIELGGGMKKEDRIRRLIPSFEKARLWMPISIKKKRVDGSVYDVMDEFRSEYESFPVGAHDDAMDCLARKEEPEMRMFLKEPNGYDDDDDEHDQTGRSSIGGY